MESEAPGKRSVTQERIVAVSTHCEMDSYIAAWDDLAAHASEPNPLYESWALLPAWKYLAGTLDIRIILVFSGDSSQQATQPLLCGLFPIVAHVKHETLHIATAAHWRHTHNILGTPLLRKGHEQAALAGLLEWVDANRSVGRMLGFEHIGGDGPIYKSLQSLVRSQKRVMFSYNEYSRGVFRPMDNAETYVRTVLSAKRRRNVRQQFTNLSKIGKLETLELKPGDDVNHWVQSFFDLEGMGWKGKSGTAIRCSPIDLRFFNELSKNAFEKRKLQLLMLRLNNRPIAMQYNLVSHQAVFSLKTAFDESFRQYSPGILLGIEAIRCFHDSTDVSWVDSGPTAPVNAVRESIWNDSRLIRHVLVSTCDKLGKAILRVLPATRTMRRSFRSLKQ